MHGSMSLALTGCTFSFSGGKDSTVLLHIAREMYPDMKALYCDTGLEYPECRNFVKTFDNVDWVRPKKHFKQVCEEYGFPLISKEVSEKAYYAKRYLTWWLEQNSLDRPTDRSSVCIRHSGFNGGSQQKRQSISGNEEGEYP